MSRQVYLTHRPSHLEELFAKRRRVGRLAASLSQRCAVALLAVASQKGSNML